MFTFEFCLRELACIYIFEFYVGGFILELFVLGELGFAALSWSFMLELYTEVSDRWNLRYRPKSRRVFL